MVFAQRHSKKEPVRARNSPKTSTKAPLHVCKNIPEYNGEYKTSATIF